MRFGERGSLMQFRKKSSYDDDDSDIMLLDYSYYAGEYDQCQARKREILMRFDKKSSLMRFGRSADISDKHSHKQWRFGREEEDLFDEQHNQL